MCLWAMCKIVSMDYCQDSQWIVDMCSRKSWDARSILNKLPGWCCRFLSRLMIHSTHVGLCKSLLLVRISKYWVSVLVDLFLRSWSEDGQHVRLEVSAVQSRLCCMLNCLIPLRDIWSAIGHSGAQMSHALRRPE